MKTGPFVIGVSKISRKQPKCSPHLESTGRLGLAASISWWEGQWAEIMLIDVWINIRRICSSLDACTALHPLTRVSVFSVEKAKGRYGVVSEVVGAVVFFMWLIYLFVYLLQLIPTDGLVRRHSHLRIGRYHQVQWKIITLVVVLVDFLCEFYGYILLQLKP